MQCPALRIGSRWISRCGWMAVQVCARMCQDAWLCGIALTFQELQMYSAGPRKKDPAMLRKSGMKP